LILNDLAKVIYAPKKAFKDIIANPKYLGVIIVLILFMALQVGYQYIQFSKTNVEQTEPQAGLFQTLTDASSGYWLSSSNVVLSNNTADYLNQTLYVSGYGYLPYVYGNSSLQLRAENVQNISATVSNAFNVDCSASGFQNISMVMKLVAPQATPQSATLTLYSLGHTDFYQYDLTSTVSNNTLIGQWNNITVPIGPNAEEWTETGNPTWSNITSLKLDFTYPETSNITIRISALYFRGDYVTLAENGGTMVLFSILQVFSLQFLVSWLVLTGVIYLVLKGLKATVVWKPLFVAIGFALVVMVIRAAISLIATVTLPALYYPYELWTGIGFTPYGVLTYPSQAIDILPVDAQNAYATMEAASAVFKYISLAIFAIAYVWLGALMTVSLGELKPEYSLLKRIAISSIAIGVTLLVLLFLVTGMA
jgi:hypothetical protein